MLKSSMYVADVPEWRHRYTHYSSEVNGSLRKAYELLAQAADRQEALTRIVELLTPIARVRMSLPQQRNVSFLMGMARASQNRYEEAQAFLEDAYDQSVELGDLAAIAEVAFLCGCLARDRLRLSAAATYFEAAIAATQQLSQADQKASADRQLEMWVQLAFATFYLARYDEVSTQLDQARQLLPLLSSRSRAGALIEWIEALLRRWTGDWEQGLKQAHAVADVVSRHTSAASVARAKLLVAEIALDCAEQCSSGEQTEEYGYTTLAAPYVRDALSLTRAGADRAGLGLALLADTRLSRLQRRNAPRIEVLEHVAGIAKQLGDTALLAQAHTALGDEFRGSGQTEPALICYRATLDALAQSETPALGVWAQRHLLRNAEFQHD